MARAPSQPGSRTGLAILLLLATLIAASAAVCQVWTRLRSIHYGYRISDATRQQVQLLEANRKLRLEVALLTSPQRVAQEVASLSLQQPTPEQVRRLRWRDGPRVNAGRAPALAKAAP